MKALERICVVMLATLVLQGCGTVVSISNSEHEGERRSLIYGGVRFDYHAAFDSAYWQHAPFMKPLCVFDMPISVAADTIVLPYTAIKRRYPEPEPGPIDVATMRQQADLQEVNGVRDMLPSYLGLDRSSIAVVSVDGSLHVTISGVSAPSDKQLVVEKIQRLEAMNPKMHPVRLEFGE